MNGTKEDAEGNNGSGKLSAYAEREWEVSLMAPVFVCFCVSNCSFENRMNPLNLILMLVMRYYCLLTRSNYTWLILWVGICRRKRTEGEDCRNY